MKTKRLVAGGILALAAGGALVAMAGGDIAHEPPLPEDAGREHRSRRPTARLRDPAFVRGAYRSYGARPTSGSSSVARSFGSLDSRQRDREMNEAQCLHGDKHSIYTRPRSVYSAKRVPEPAPSLREMCLLRALVFEPRVHHAGQMPALSAARVLRRRVSTALGALALGQRELVVRRVPASKARTPLSLQTLST